MTGAPDDQALQIWMVGNLPGFEGPFTVTKFAGGQSNPTFKVDAASGRYVLRRKPMGQLLPSAHAVDREYRILSAIWPTGFPVPRPLGFCGDSSVIGSDFYVMELIEGENYWQGTLPGLALATRRTIYDAMVDTLAMLHGIDVDGVGLGSFGRPDGYLERQVRRWITQYRQSETERIEDMERLIDWLPRGVPQQDRSAIVHGDYRIDNLIFGPAGAVRAVLDWELSTLGDPLADFSYFALQWILPADGMMALGGLDLPALGIPTLDEVIARYCAATGRRSLPDLGWHFAFNLFRLAAIVQGIKKRVLDGTASNPNAAETAGRVPLFAAEGWKQAVAAQGRRQRA